MKARLAFVALFLLLTGCGTIQQEVKPVALSGSAPREICLIENPAVRQNFLPIYKDALSQKGFTVRMLPPGASEGECPLTSTYQASWRWDLALYLAYCDLKVFRDGHLEGEAQYDSMGAMLNTSKFIDATKKIQELTDQLFPR
jgi:hypothetical protein